MNFSKKLLRWYHAHKRDLPWRGINDPYQTWVSEIMLQQTTVATVIPKFRRWIKIFPTMDSLAAASLQTVLTEWQGLGYYNRAKNLHRTAKIICQDYQGCIPQDKKILLTLPGFGPYTAGAVLSIAYNKCVPIIDANVRRVMMRILALAGKADGTHDKRIYSYLETIMPVRSAGNFNQALMELGALVCDQRKPLCLQCPLRFCCKAYEQNIQETIPQPVKKHLKEIFAVIALVKWRGRYLIQQRPSRGLLADLWEFPGGKIEKDETAREALEREVKEELGVKIVSAQHYMKTHHFYTDYKVNLDVWTCRLLPCPLLNKKQRWVTLQEFPKFPFASGTVKIIEKIRRDSYENHFNK